MGQRRFIRERNFESPYGKDSLFHNVYLDLENVSYPNDETDENDKYTYKIIPCESGIDVFNKHKSSEYKPTSRHAYIFIEKEDNSKSNFFGTACRVKMGIEWKVLAEKLDWKNKRVSVNDDTNLARNLKELAEDISYYSLGKNTQIDKKVLLDAFNLEISNVFTDDNLFQDIFSLNNKLAEWIYSGSEVIEKWKFTEENYEFKRKNYNREIEVYKPIIPVPFEVAKQDFSNKETKVAQNKGFDNILNFVNNFDSVLFNAQTLTAVLTPTNPIDDLVVLGLRAYYQAKLPDSIKRIFDKIKSVVNQIKNFINDVVKEKINENVALLNAFLCGLINGLISLLQMVILLLGFVVDNIPLLEIEKAFSREAIDKRDKQFEFIEDVIDIISENVSGLFGGLIKTFVNLPSDFVNFVKDLSVKFINKSQYFWAFIIGAIGFELILDVVIAFFTGGTSLAVSFANKISRATTKATQAGIKLAKQTGKKITTSVDDIYKFLKQEIEELIKAISDGELLEWLKGKLLTLFSNDKLDDVVSLLPERKLSVAASKVKINQINKALLKSTAIFNSEKEALKKLGVKLFKSKNGLCVDFKKTPKYLYDGKANRKSIVKIKLKGSRKLDRKAAFKKAGFSDEQIKLIKEDYTWHHLDDYNTITGEATMQLVDKEIHIATYPHIGSVKQVERFFDITYKK